MACEPRPMMSVFSSPYRHSRATSWSVTLLPLSAVTLQSWTSKPFGIFVHHPAGRRHDLLPRILGGFQHAGSGDVRGTAGVRSVVERDVVGVAGA